MTSALTTGPSRAAGEPLGQGMGQGAKQAGTIVLARHGEPALSRKVRLTSKAYADWWAVYEETGLVPGQIAPKALIAHAEQAHVIRSSTRRRSIETADVVGGRSEVRAPPDPDLIEAPLPPPNWPGWIKLSPRLWGVVARTWWWFLNHHDGQETRKEAQARAEAVADKLAADADAGMNVLVIAHGFFNTMVRLALQKRGWKLVENRGFKYWSYSRLQRG